MLCTVDTHDDVLRYMGRFMQYYREHGQVSRAHLRLRRARRHREDHGVVVDDSEGIAARLDAEMQKAVDAYVDPWKEAFLPATPNQFVSLLPVIQ